MGESNKPTHEIRYGNVRASIWMNKSSIGEVWYTVTTSRLYKNANQQWQSAHSFRMREIPMLAAAPMSACNWIVAEDEGDKDKSGVECMARRMEEQAFVGGSDVQYKR